MPVEFLLVGSGWRAEFFIRLARKLPECFAISAVVTANEEKTRLYSAQGFRCVKTAAEGLKVGAPVFAVVSVKMQVIPQMVRQILAGGLPVLSETPAAPDYEALKNFVKELPFDAKYQVAEQYHLRPDHAARLACIKSGKIGRPVQALISLTNNYHAISLMRMYLNEKGDQAVVRGQCFQIPGKPGFERGGMPKQPDTRMYQQTLATFQFGDRYGIYNFEADQHRSYIRSQHIQIKGDNGEINNQQLRYLNDNEPVYSCFLRMNKGENENMEGSGLKGLLLEGEWIYRNPYADVGLSDDEIAVAQCLDKMNDYCCGGPSFYGIAEAAQDYYLTFLLEEAVKTGKEITAKEQLWTHLLYEN